jgi:hypothetical protein
MRFTIALFFLLFIFNVQSQKPEAFNARFNFTDGIEIKREFKHEFIGNDGEYTYSSDATFAINKWDKDMNLAGVGKIPIKTPDYKLSAKHQGILKIIGTKLIHIIENKNKKSGEIEIFITEYDKNSFQIKKSQKISSYGYNKKMKSKVMVISSPDNEGEFGIVAMVGNKLEVKTKAKFFVLNDDLEIVYKEDLKLNAKIYKLQILNGVIHDNGLSFIASNSSVREIENKYVELDKATFHMLNRKTNNHIEIPIQLNELERDINDFEFTFNDNDQLLISGFYKAIGEKNDDVAGAFTQLYDLSKGELVDQFTHPFDFEYLTNNASSRIKKMVTKYHADGEYFDPYEYLVHHVVTNKDGSSTMVGECYRYYEFAHDGVSYSNYIHGDLIIMRTSKDGEIEWLKRMPKYNHFAYVDYGQFIFHDNDSTFEVIYTEGRSLKIAQINKKDGTSKKEVVFKVKSNNILEPVMEFVMNRATQVGGHSYTIQVKNFNILNFLKIEFDQE